MSQTLQHDLMLYLIAGAFALARVSGMMLVTPVFTRFGLGGMVQNAVGLALCLPLFPMLFEAQKTMPDSWVMLALLLGKETVVGMLIGFVAGVPFWAAQAAGALLDTQRGAAMATMADASGELANITGTLLTFVMLMLFLTNGGMLFLMGAFYDSYSVWPVNQLTPLFSTDAADHLLRMLDKIYSMGVLMVVPIVLALLMSDVLLGLVSRAAPQLHIFDLSLNVKSLAFAGLLVLYWSFIVKYMEFDLGYLIDIKEKFEALRGPVTR
jgi:type III secretion protein T